MSSGTARWLLVGLVVAALSGHAGAAAAQAGDCTWDRCALRVQYRFLGNRIVQGIDARPVAPLGFLPARIDVLAGSADSARFHYEAYRVHQTRASILAVASFAAAIGTLVAIQHESYSWSGPSLGLLALSAGISIGSGVSAQLGANQLQQAMWHYNRSLAGR